MATLNFIDYSSDTNGIKHAEIEKSLLDIKNMIKEKDKSYSQNIALLLRDKQLLEEKIDILSTQLEQEKKLREHSNLVLSTQLEQEKKLREQSDLIFGRKIATFAGRVNYLERCIYATKTTSGSA